MHTPVLLKEVLEYLDPQSNEDVIDATVNGGGHAEALLTRIAPEGKLLGIDRDPSLLRETGKRFKRFGDRAVLAEGNFADIAQISRDAGVLHPSCVLFDLGFSSYHLASAGRGFSFQRNEPLDMRFNPQEGSLTAEAIVNHAPPEELERIFKTYGEERKARRIAEIIVSERKHRSIQTTGDLVSLIERALPRGRIHPATRIFQALRIAVNNELEHIEAGVKAAIEIASPGARIAVISFHSLEDRLIKNLFRENAKELGAILTKKPVRADREESRINPRSRSAKLRVFRKS
jgi:16S rRNA (cytosine1402-N4)-methyltransferase